MQHKDMGKIPSERPHRINTQGTTRASRSILTTLEKGESGIHALPPSRNEANTKEKGKRHLLHNFFSGWTSLKAPCIVVLILISVMLHLVGMQGIYSIVKARKTPPVAKAVFKIEPVKIYQVSPDITKKSEPRPSKKESAPIKRAEVKKKERSNTAKPSSEKALVALGRKYLPMLGSGSFPGLSLSYKNPTSFIREMYRLGAMTVVLNKDTQEFSRINLFNGDISPLTRSDFAGFSDFKRVIKDSLWDKTLARAADRLGTTRPMVSLLLVVPVSVESLWIGQQVRLFQEMHLDISTVASVDALFEKSRLIVTRVHLADGSSETVKYPTGA